MRAVVVGWVVLAACGGEERMAWRATVEASSVDTRLVALQTGLSEPAARSAVIVREEPCPAGGRATRCDDGTVAFEDCVFEEGESLDGTLRVTEGNPRVWAYENLTGLSRGQPFSVSGGYTTTSDGTSTTTVLDLTHTGVDEGTAFTAVATGSMTAAGDAVSGSLTYVTTREGEDPHTIGCAFTDARLPMNLDGFDDFDAWAAEFDRAMEEACAFDVKAVVRRMHRHSGDPDPIHILVDGEPFDEVENKVNPGGTTTERLEDPVIGQTVNLAVGRGGTVFATTTCVVSDENEVIEAVYEEGLGLDPFSFTCTSRFDRGEP